MTSQTGNIAVPLGRALEAVAAFAKAKIYGDDLDEIRLSVRLAAQDSAATLLVFMDEGERLEIDNRMYLHHEGQLIVKTRFGAGIGEEFSQYDLGYARDEAMPFEIALDFLQDLNSLLQNCDGFLG